MRNWSLTLLARNAVVLALLLEVLVFAVLTDRFLTVANFRVVLIQSAVIAILAIPTALLLMSGYLDLSMGSVAGASGVMLGMLLVDQSLVVALPLTIAFAAGIGLVQGVLATRLSLSPLVVTLGFFSAVRGLALVLSEGQLRSGVGAPGLDFLGRGVVLGVPTPVAIAIGVLVLGMAVLYRTRWGRYIVAIGDNPTAAFRAGVAVNAVPMWLYVATAAAAGLAGSVMVARLASAPPTLGQGLELEVLTAVLIGGVAFGGGRGNLLGVVAGVLFVSILGNGLLHLGVRPFWSTLSVGVALVLAAGLEALSRRVEARNMSALAARPGEADGGVDAIRTDASV